MIKFLLLVSNKGMVRVSKYYSHVDESKQKTKEAEVIRLCLARDKKQSNFLDHEDYTIVYRNYVSLFLVAGITRDENELAIFELFQHILETLHKYLEPVSEVNIMNNLDRVHMIIDEMIINGYIAETSQDRILAPIQLLTASKR